MNIRKFLNVVVLTVATVFCFRLGYAISMDTWTSSNTATADNLQNLCIGTNFLVGTSTVTRGNHGVFHGACIGAGVAASSVTVYNSSGTSQNPIAVIATSTPTVPCSYFDVSFSTGLTYTSGSTANVTLLYQCF